MIRLPDSLRAWPDETFPQILKQEIQALPTHSLPLHQATTHGGYVSEENTSCSVLSYSSDAGHIRAKVAVFFHEIVIGCSCGDDPFEENAYCELAVEIDMRSGAAELRLLDERAD